jgi:hypothetical protein
MEDALVHTPLLTLVHVIAVPIQQSKSFLVAKMVTHNTLTIGTIFLMELASLPWMVNRLEFQLESAQVMTLASKT